MTTRIAPVALAIGLMLAGSLSAEAQDWQRNRATTGPNGGQWGMQGSGSCAGGGCASQQRWTDPRGGVATRSGTTACAGGSCNGSATYTGPRGQSATRTRSFTRN